jgi:putative ABC transport system permease protein
MIRHLIRLMWNRKRQNLLLFAELFFAFLVATAAAVIVVHFGNNARHPLGFQADRVWTIEVSRGRAAAEDDGAKERDRQLMRDVMREVAVLPGVEAVSAAFTGPYRWYSWTSTLDLEDGRSIYHSVNHADDRFRDVLGVDVLAGRWFSREDDGGTTQAVVMNERLAREVFGAVNPIGQILRPRPSRLPGANPTDRPLRVVGVIRDFRQFGELSTPDSVMIYRDAIDGPIASVRLPEVLLVRVAPGSTAELEERIVRRLGVLAPGWTATVQPVEALREAMLRDDAIPLAIFGVLAGSMLLMVAMGLSGVLWQNVTRRTREFGLRRAQGATAQAISRQIVGEFLVLTTFAVLAGILLLAQIPLLPFPPDITLVPRGVFVLGMGAAIAAMYGVTALCAWYPSRLATRIPPAEALHYE